MGCDRDFLRLSGFETHRIGDHGRDRCCMTELELATARLTLRAEGFWAANDSYCLPAELHNRPGGIPAAVRGRIADARADGFDHIFVAYADCGTGGLLDRVLA